VDDLPASYVAFVEQLHAIHNHEGCFRLLSDALGVRIKPGTENSFVPGPTPTIVLEPHLYGWSNSSVGMHELGHLFTSWSGIEKRLLQECGDRDRALEQMERLAHLTITVLKIPRHLVDEAIGLHGATPAAILHLRERAGVTLEEAMRRFVYADPDTSRAAFVTSGNYVTDLAAHNVRLPFQQFDRVPDLGIQHPDMRLIAVKPGKYLGMPLAANDYA